MADATLPAPMQDTPTRILHVVFSLDVGGLETGVLKIARGLDPEEFETHVCCLERKGVLADQLPPRSTVHALVKRDGYSIASVFGLRRLIRNLKPDIVHSHDIGPLLYSIPAVFPFQSPPVFHGEHIQLCDEHQSPKRLRQRRFCYPRCSRIHTVAKSLRDQLVSLDLPTINLVTIPNGVDCEHFQSGNQQHAREQLGLPRDATVLAMVGALKEHKQHRKVLKLLCRNFLEENNIQFLIVGNGPEEQSLKEQTTQLGLEARVRFVSQQENLIPYYHAMDLLVVASSREGMSNVILEAMACGTPVFAADTPWNREVISNGYDGYLADLESPAKSRDILQEIIQNQTTIRKTGDRARKTVETRFTLEKMIGEYARHYREIAAGQESPSPK